MTEILMKRGASVLVKNKYENTALDEAMDNETLKIIQSYLEDKLYKFVLDIRNHFPCGCQELNDDLGNEIGFYVENPFPNPHKELSLVYDLETFHELNWKMSFQLWKMGLLFQEKLPKMD